MNDKFAAGATTATARAIALLHEQARELRAEFLNFQPGAPRSKWFNGMDTAHLKQVNQRLVRAALRAAAIADTAIDILVALPVANSPDAGAPDALPPDHESASRHLREVNERLIVASLRAQQLEHETREAQRLQLNFMAVLAHELRNPMAALSHAIKLLGNEASSDEQKRRSQDVIGRQVEHMARLLDDLLDGARIARGQLVLRPSPVNLRSIVRDAVDVATPLIEKHHHTLEVKLPDEPLVVMVDAVRIAQILSNLLTNAAKYSAPGGRITISATIDADHFAIAVRDTGIGIPPEAMADLFTMFTQRQSTLDHSEGGLGIGLAFANELAKLHGGRIDAHSEGEGHGSEFVVLLPATIVQQEPPSAPTRRPTIARAPGTSLVLIADDNVDAATSLGMLLQMAGNEVLIVHNGIDAVEEAQRHRPQTAILDIGMPGMNGHEVAEKIRGEPWGKDVLLIALTGWGHADDRARTLAAGFDHHLTKPVEADVLQALISAREGQTVNAGGSIIDVAPLPIATRASLNDLASERNAQTRQARRHLKHQDKFHAIRTADLVEANEHLVLAALHAETLVTTAEGNLSTMARANQRDVLTDTPNRALMLDRLEGALAMARRRETHVAVVFVDLDHFKRINDTFGHAVGDDVLQRAARLLESVLRSSDTVSRHGGDEFLVLLTEVAQRPNAAAIAAKMLQALSELSLPDAQVPTLSASIGISVYPEDGADAQSLISRADAAMYRAKQNGRACFAFYAE